MAEHPFGDIQITINHVNHAKQPGSIRLSMSHVLWDPELVGEKLILDIPEIKNQKISPDGKTKVQIQLQMKDGRAITFHFATGNEQGSPKELRNKVKTHLGKMIGKIPTKKIDKVFEERKKILSENPDLLILYKDLVKSGMITPEEFWSTREHMLTMSHAQGTSNLQKKLYDK